MSYYSNTASQNHSSVVPYFENCSQQHYASSDVGACKIKRLLAESVEVALTLCHRNLGSIGNIKLFDIVNQILPTGWVLNTGYWVYYSNQLGHSLCVCAKFAIHCRHVRNYDHWIDLHSTCDNLEDASTVVLPASASLSVTNFECNVTAMGYDMYNISAKFQLHIQTTSDGNFIEKKNMWFEGSYAVTVERYMTSEVFIMFHPNPQSMPTYGTILTETLVNHGVEETFVTSNTSKHTFILSPVTPQFSYTTLAFPLLQTPYQYRNMVIDASTQTEILSDITSSLHLQPYGHISSYVKREQNTDMFQIPSTSRSFYNQPVPPPPPYPFSKSLSGEPLLYSKGRFDKRGRKGTGAGVSSSNEDIGNLTLSMFLNNDNFNQPQNSKGRRQKLKAGRRVKTEPNKESTIAQSNVEGTSNELSEIIHSDFDVIEKFIAEDLLKK